MDFLCMFSDLGNCMICEIVILIIPVFLLWGSWSNSVSI